MAEDINDIIGRLRQLSGPAGGARDWYAVQCKADSRKATIRIFDEIGWIGVSARTFAEELDALDVDEIDLRLNSPGGNAWDGIAIFNALRAHPAKVTVTVDGVAASAASAIAMAGDTVRMSRGAQMMVHEASGGSWGPAAMMRKAAEWLDVLSDSYADIYAGKAGGTAEEWRAVMVEETWYKASEAVDAGLADELADAPDPEVTARAAWDIRAYAYAYAGRDVAPAPRLPARPEPTPQLPVTPAEAARRIHGAPTRTTTTKEGAGRMDPAKIREALGLAAEASDDEVKAALASAGLAVQPEPPGPVPEPDPTPPPAPSPSPAPPAAGTMTIDAQAWQEQQDRIRSLEAQASRQRAAERDQVIEQAVADGKFAPSRKEHWARLWDADPEGTRQVIDGLAKNVVPVAELGYGADAEADLDDEFRRFFPPEPAQKKGR